MNKRIFFLVAIKFLKLYVCTSYRVQGKINHTGIQGIQGIQNTRKHFIA